MNKSMETYMSYLSSGENEGQEPGGSPNGIHWLSLCRSRPNLAACAHIPSYYGYRIDPSPNIAFLAIFSPSLAGFAAAYVRNRRRHPFFGHAMMLGLLCEILGYAARLFSWGNQWDQDFFLMQICCLTIGPAFVAAAVYLCLGEIVCALGKENSRIAPKYFTRIFIPCDIVSLLLQATGGGLASAAQKRGEPVDTGDNIMIAGLAFQVFTLLVFILCASDFSLSAWRGRYRRRAALKKKRGYSPRVTDAAATSRAGEGAGRSSWRLGWFMAALGLATVCVFWRSVFRVAELSQGWRGPLMARQDLFVGFEGAMIAIACLVLNVMHPSFCLPSEPDEKDGEIVLDDRAAAAPAGGPAGAGKTVTPPVIYVTRCVSTTVSDVA